MRKIYFVIISLFISILTYSQTSDDDVYYDYDWVYVCKSDNGVKVFVKDVEKSYSNNYTAWVKAVKAPTKYKNKQGKWITKDNGYLVQHYSVYCDKKEYASTDYVIYNSKGEITDSGNDYGHIQKIIPDTILEGIYKYVCRK